MAHVAVSAVEARAGAPNVNVEIGVVDLETNESTFDEGTLPPTGAGKTCSF